MQDEVEVKARELLATEYAASAALLAAYQQDNGGTQCATPQSS